MRMSMKILSIILFFIFLFKSNCEVNPKKCVAWGPGLKPQLIVLPARYFFIGAVGSDGIPLTKSPGNNFTVQITGSSDHSVNCRTWLNILDRKDGTYIVRYKMYNECQNLTIHVKYNNIHIANSPFVVSETVNPEECYCPKTNFEEWLNQFGCKNTYNQIEADLKQFTNVNFSIIQAAVLSNFNNPRSTSICHYAVSKNKVYRRCYGQYVGFKMFMDAILLSLTRKVVIPDMELFVNLGDWPLINLHGTEKLPMFSWCGSDDTMDIVMPTYDITESTLENMGRVTLDMLSVQGNIGKEWDEKTEKAFWRGRDSRRERLSLIDIAREHPQLFNASLTNFFFFREEIEKYGPKENHVSFFEFFDYKYQINIDGTVASYRFPYLLAGDSLVFKQESEYYEHFYKDLEPWKHYVPFKRDLSDLVQRVLWAKENDKMAQQIVKEAKSYARENLLPREIICYYALLFNKWSKKLINRVKISDKMEYVPQPNPDSTHKQCNCLTPNAYKDRDEL